MFRSLMQSLFASRPQTKARTQVQSFRPQLEVLEGRLAPSGWHHHGVDIDQIQRDVGSYNKQIAVTPSHGNINVFQGQFDVGNGNVQVAIVGGHDHHGG